MSEVAGTVHWTELSTNDVEAAKAYYGSICGWKLETEKMASGENYTVASKGGQPVAGIMSLSDIPGGDQIPPNWMPYLAVNDVDEAVAKTKTANGTVLRDSFDVPGVGRIAIVADPTGAAIGLMKPDPSPPGG